MKVILTIFALVVSVTLPAAVTADDSSAGAKASQSKVTSVQPVSSRPAVSPASSQSKQRDSGKKSTCNGPTKGSVTYAGGKKRYDLMGRRIK